MSTKYRILPLHQVAVLLIGLALHWHLCIPCIHKVLVEDELDVWLSLLIGLACMGLHGAWLT